MRSENAARIVFAVLFALVVYLMYLIFRPFLAGILWAMVLVIAFHPLHRRLVRLLGGRSWMASVIMSALVAAFIVVPAILLLIKVGQGVVQAYNWLEARQAAGRPMFDPRAIPGLAAALDWVGQYVDLSRVDLRGMALSALRTVGNALAGGTRRFVTNALQGLLTLVVLLATMTVTFHEGPGLVERIRRFLPLSEHDKHEVFTQLQTVTRAVLFGVLLTAFVQAVLASVGFAVLSVPAPVALGAAVFFCALIPGGPVAVWGPAAVWLYVAGHPVKALILVVWGAAVIGSMDNLIRPVFISRGVRMHMLLVFFGIFGGMMAFGLIGLFAGPLVITLFLFMLEVVRRDLFRPGGGNGHGGQGPGGNGAEAPEEE